MVLHVSKGERTKVLLMTLLFGLAGFSPLQGQELPAANVGVLEHFQPLTDVWAVRTDQTPGVKLLRTGDLLSFPAEETELIQFQQHGRFFMPRDFRFVPRFVLKFPAAESVRIVLNGKAIGPFNGSGSADGMVYKTLRRKDFSFDKVNEITVYLTVSADREIYIRNMMLARENGLSNHISPEYINFFNGQLYTFFSIFMTYFTFLYFLVRRKEFFHLFFTAANALFAVYFYRMAYEPLFLSHFLSFTISKAALPLGLSFFTTAFISYYNIYNTRKIRWSIIAWGAILASILLLVPFERQGQVYSLFSKLLLFLMPMVVFVFWINWKAFRSHNPDAKAVFFGITIAAVFALHDIGFVLFKTFDLFKPYYFAPVMWLQGIGLFVFNISIFTSLALRTMRARADLESYTAQVEDLVRERTAELDSATMQAESANRAKTEFLANVSHEMRTPLNAIMGFGEALHDKLSEGNNRQFAGLIVDESKRLTELIDELLDISKIEAGRLDLVEEPFDLTALITSIGEMLARKALRKGLELQINIPEELPRTVIGDAIRLRQVLINLVDNGIKYTEDGSVSLTAELLNIDGDILLFAFTIKDTGVGIDEKHLSRLFDKFYQIEEGRTRSVGGFGLGTAISKLIIDKMGGSLDVRSTLGVGSEFTVQVNLLQAQTESSADPVVVVADSSDFYDLISGCRVLAVDDYPTNLRMLEYHLHSLSCPVDCVENGGAALDLLSRKSFDVILMDISMPGIDGRETTRQLRARGIVTPVIAVTANAFREEFATYREAGMNGVLIKPYKRIQLVQAIADQLKLSGAEIISEDEVRAEGAPEVLDYQQLSTDFSGNTLLIREFLGGFLADTKPRIERVADALERQDAKALHREYHAIKGGAYTVSALSLGACCAKLEQLARQEQLTVCKEKHTLFLAEIRNLETECEKIFPRGTLTVPG